MLTHESRQLPAWLILNVGQKIVIRTFAVLSPRKAATGIDGGHTYVSGVTVWNGVETPVFVFLKNEAEEKKVEAAGFSIPMVFEAQRHDFVVGHGLSLFDAELK